MLKNNLDKPPLFSVGEEVMLQSNSFPNLNGEAVVLDVSTGTPDGLIENWAYELSIEAPSGLWDQSALRKKHKPSDHSFDSLIAELKGKEPRNAKA